ncbi:MAG: hypothetical protein VX772_00835, partial [Bacteroidota bacterium]|nr:hypothetical protein [Bacteroidota bacterium]
DNEENGNGFSSAELVGTWDLIAVNVSTAVDLDGDGTTSTNLMDEEDCITGTIVLRDDTTYQFEQTVFNITTITNNQYVVQCSGMSQATGAWASDGLQVVFQGSTLLGTLELKNNTVVKNEGEELPGVASFVYERR